MIFNAQRHRELTKGAPFRIELIMRHKTGQGIREDCSYLKNLTPLGHLTEGDFDAFRDEDSGPLTSEMKNPLFYWMKEKIRFHRRQGHLGPGEMEPAIAEIEGDRGP